MLLFAGLAGCAAASATGSDAARAEADPAADSAAVTMEMAARYDNATICRMLGEKKIWLERDTVSDSWILRDSAGVVMKNVVLETPGSVMKLDAKYGINLVK